MLVAFASQVLSAPSAELPALAARIQAAIAQNRVGDRPDRYEPRARKRRYDNFQQLRRPRAEAQARSLKGICDDFK